jgi:Spy/CpxP family protein refolding chaperone
VCAIDAPGRGATALFFSGGKAIACSPRNRLGDVPSSLQPLTLMKKITTLALTLCGVSGLLAVAVFAANPSSVPAVSSATPAVTKPANRLGLTAEQQAKLASLREQMKAVLTPEQQQQMAQARERFHRRGPGDRASFHRGSRGQPDFQRHRADRPGSHRLAGHRGGPQVRHDAARMHLRKMQQQRERRAERLGLTDEQRAKMRQIAFQNREKAIGLRKELRTEMESVLTPEQKARVQELKAGHGRRGAGRHQAGERRGPPRAN